MTLNPFLFQTGLMYWPFMQVRLFLQCCKNLSRAVECFYSLTTWNFNPRGNRVATVTVRWPLNLWPDPSVPELRPDAALHANGLHGLLRLPLGLLPLLFPAERRRHRCRGPGLRHGPSQDPGGDARGPSGAQEATDAEEQLRTIRTNKLSHAHTPAGEKHISTESKVFIHRSAENFMTNKATVAGGGCCRTPGEASGSSVTSHHTTRAFLSGTTVLE